MEGFKVPTAIVKPPPPVICTKQATTTDGTENTKEVPVADQPSNTSAPNDAKCPYIVPKWSAQPHKLVDYKFEVLKSGTIVEEIENLQRKAHWMFGRLPGNDIEMAHPTISRFHAVLQYRPEPDSIEGEGSSATDESRKPRADNKFGEGWYIYDLGSTHGTFVNKMQIPPKTYIPVRVGHIITLGGSTRKYILQGPEFDEEPESELTVTELKQKRANEEEDRRKYEEMQEEMREKEGITWGMGEDADEETDLSVNPYASTNNEEFFLDDPKKTLRGFFEREGLDLEYKADEMSLGTFICRVELPIDDEFGKPIVAEVCHKGKKKECVLQCALEACRILDRHGILRQSHHEPMKRKAPQSDSDDDDDFLDRTGDVEKKKLRKANTGQSAALTYDDLVKQDAELTEKLSSIKDKLNRHQEEAKRIKEKEAAQEDDDLDDFMNNLSHEKAMDKAEIRKLRMEEQRLETEHQKLQRLIKLTKPTQLPSLNTTNDDVTQKKTFLPLFGKRNKTKFQFVTKTVPTKKIETKEYRSDEEEIEEDDTEGKEEPKTETTKTIDSAMIVKADVKKKIIPTTSEIETSSGNALQDGSPRAVKGPAFIPPKYLPTSPTANISNNIVEVKNIGDSATADEAIHGQIDEEDIDTAEDPANASKKRRNRNRYRTKGRENVDIDDKEELADSEKYSGWVPPQNQTGDGITSLNQKFGY